MEFTHRHARTIYGDTDIFDVDSKSFFLAYQEGDTFVTLHEKRGERRHSALIFLQGWKTNWLTNNNFHEELEDTFPGNTFRCSVERTAQGMTFTSEDTTRAYIDSVAIPECVIRPMTTIMVKHGLILPLPDSTRQDTLNSLLLTPRE